MLAHRLPLMLKGIAEQGVVQLAAQCRPRLNFKLNIKRKLIEAGELSYQVSFEMVPEFPTRIARVGAVLTLLGSVVWVQWPIDLSKFNFAAMILFVASLATWASIELADSKNVTSSDNIMSDDVDKLNSLLKMIDRKQFYILKNKAIETYMNDDDYDGLRDLISHKDDDIFPFHNKNIQSLYERFGADARDFYSGYYGIYSYDGHDRATWRPPGGGYVDEETYKKIRTKIAELDRKASKLAELWQELINVSREELKGASKAIERYEM